jgi:hypothetical protein
MPRAGVSLVVLALVAAALSCEAQDLEPRAYANTPVGMNFLILGYSYTRGEVAFDTSVPIEDAKLSAHSAVLAYSHAFGVWGRSAKLDLVLPYAWVSGTAEVAGQRRDRYVSGFGDARIRLSGLLYGGPALSLADFADYKPDFIVGASLAVTLPLGQYDSDKLVNIGTNRWSVKPELGISKTFGPVTLELETSATFYTDNNDFPGRQDAREGPALCGAGARDLPHELRPVGGRGRHLLHGRAHDDRRRARRGAPESARRRDARDPDHPAPLGQALRQHGRHRARRRQLHHGRRRLAVSLGRRSLISP